MSELELKFVVSPERQPALAKALREAGAKSSRLIAHYYDTEDGVLSRHGVSLRLRKEGMSWVQTLKVSSDSRVQRLEHGVPVARGSSRVPKIDLALHDDTEVAAVLRRALKHAAAVGGSSLIRRFSIDVQRLSVDTTVSDSVVEVSFDRGKIVADNRVARISEVEYELKCGEPSVLASLAHEAVRDQGLWLNVASKAERGERLLRSDPEVAPVYKAKVPMLHGQMSGTQVVRVTVQACLEQILANAGEVAGETGGDDNVHQLRVGIRRLRTVMRELGDVAPGINPAWETPLIVAFRKLGAYRDTTTVLGAVRPMLAEAGAPRLDTAQPAHSSDHPAPTVRDANFQENLIDLIGFTLQAEPPDPGLALDDLKIHLRGRLKKLRRQVVQAGRNFEHLDESAQHRVRKRLKRLRYLAESVSDLYGRAAVNGFLDRLGPAQDALGEHNDTIVAREAYGRIARQSDAQAWFAVGWLKAHQATTATACRKALRKVGAAQRFW